jgi:hypothetical protein
MAAIKAKCELAKENVSLECIRFNKASIFSFLEVIANRDNLSLLGGCKFNLGIRRSSTHTAAAPPPRCWRCKPQGNLRVQCVNDLPTLAE